MLENNNKILTFISLNSAVIFAKLKNTAFELKGRINKTKEIKCKRFILFYSPLKCLEEFQYNYFQQ